MHEPLVFACREIETKKSILILIGIKKCAEQEGTLIRYRKMHTVFKKRNTLNKMEQLKLITYSFG